MCRDSHPHTRHGMMVDPWLCVWHRVAPARRDPVALPQAPRVAVGVAGAEQPRPLARLLSPVGLDAPGHLSPGSCVPAHASYGSDQTVSIGCGPRYQDREARRPSPPVRAAPTRPCTSPTPPLHAQCVPVVRPRVRGDPYHPARLMTWATRIAWRRHRPWTYQAPAVPHPALLGSLRGLAPWPSATSLALAPPPRDPKP